MFTFLFLSGCHKCTTTLLIEKKKRHFKTHFLLFIQLVCLLEYPTFPPLSNIVVNLPCNIYCKPVAKNLDNFQCDKCNKWLLRNFNKINKKTYSLLQKDKNLHWFCIICAKDCLSFSNLNNDEFIQTIKDKKVKFTNVIKNILTAEAGFFSAN